MLLERTEEKKKLTSGWLSKPVKRGNSRPTSMVDKATGRQPEIKTDIYGGTDGRAINIRCIKSKGSDASKSAFTFLDKC